MHQGKFNRNYLYGCVRTRCIIWKHFHSCNLSIKFGYICMVIFRRSTQLSSRLERSGCVAASMSPETCSTWNGSTQITTFMGRFMGHLGADSELTSQTELEKTVEQGVLWWPVPRPWHLMISLDTYNIYNFMTLILRTGETLARTGCKRNSPFWPNASETPFIYKFGL